MSGNSYNKQTGQVLLITLMLLATVLTVTLAVTFKSSTETQVTKLEEESQKALSAAEAGIEAALKQGNTDLSTLNLTGFSGQATVTNLTGDEFVSPLLQKDEEYTFYLTDYSSSGLGTAYWGGLGTNLDVNFGSESRCPSLELTFVKSNNSLVRNVMDPCTPANIAGQAASFTSTTAGSSLQGTPFQYKGSFNVTATNKLLIVRVISAPTRIGFKGSSNLQAQGNFVTSEAKSTTGVTKKVQLFQSYPQIPGDFFVTSF